MKIILNRTAVQIQTSDNLQENGTQMKLEGSFIYEEEEIGPF